MSSGTMGGGAWLAASLAASGQTHVFFVDAVLRRTLLALSEAGVAPVLAHTEKAAVYMADGYARVSGRPGVVAAQSVGAANLAAGLQDAWLARTPIVAMTGRKVPAHQQHLAELAHLLLEVVAVVGGDHQHRQRRAAPRVELLNQLGAGVAVV